MTTIKLRRGLSTAFSTNNPVLAAGEPAFATDTGILKIGDGTTAYNSLPSIGASPDLSNYVTTNTAQTISAAKTFTQTSGNPLLQGTNGDGGYKVGFMGTSSNRAGMMVYNSSGQAGYSIGSNNNSDVFTAAARFISDASGSAQVYANNQLALWGSSSKFIKINSSGVFIGDTNKVLDASCVDGTTITYNSSTGKISATGGASIDDTQSSSSTTYSSQKITNTFVASTDIRNIVKLTQAAYDALATKDANTFYVIIPSA